jgi:hypothetical protein
MEEPVGRLTLPLQRMTLLTFSFDAKSGGRPTLSAVSPSAISRLHERHDNTSACHCLTVPQLSYRRSIQPPSLLTFLQQCIIQWLLYQLWLWGHTG